MERQLKKLIEDFEQKKYQSPLSSKKFGTTYTPQEIVEYMCKKIFSFYLEKYLTIHKINTKGLDFEGFKTTLKTNPNIRENLVQDLKSIKILDPSCGSGRFLIGLAEQLLSFFEVLNPANKRNVLKQQIIENNIYGLDIEQKACTISKLRLVLWLNSERDTSIFQNIERGKTRNIEEIEKELSELAIDFNIHNIETLLNYNTTERFDIVIGNPPYVENKKIKDTKYKRNLYDSYQSAYKLFDLSILFVEKGLRLLKPEMGLLCFIITNKFLSADYGIKIRKILIENTQIKELINISTLPVFKHRSTYPIIITLDNQPPKEHHTIRLRKYERIKDLIAQKHHIDSKVRQKNLKSVPKCVIPIKSNLKFIVRLFLTHESMKEKYDDLNIVYRPYGFTNYNKFFDKTPKNRNVKEILPILIGTGNVGQFHVKFNKRIRIAKRDLGVSPFIFPPDPSKKRYISSQKLMIREIAKKLTCAYDHLGLFTNVTGLYFIIIPSLPSEKLFGLMTILNSSFLDHIFKSLYGSLHMKGKYLRFNASFIETLPMPPEIPGSLSNIGKLLQFLTQLKYDRNHNKNYNSSLKTPDIKNMLDFFTSLSESLTRFLYCSEIISELNGTYRELRTILHDPDAFPLKEYKYTYPYFHSSTFQTFDSEKITSELLDLKLVMEELNQNKRLGGEIEEITGSLPIL